MLDSAVTWFGITIENLLSERVKVTMGKETKYNPRYTLTRLLDAGFKILESPEQMVQQSANPWAALEAWAGRGNSRVKRYQYKKVVGEGENV